MYSNTSAVNNSDMQERVQESGIRASNTRSDNLRPTSSMMPSAHCSEEKRERRRMERRCYYCNMPGHQISSCQEKEKDEESQLLRQAVDAGTQKNTDDDNSHQIDRRLEFIIDGTEGGCWSDIWYVSKSLKHHFSSNIDMFKRIKNMSHVETMTGEKHFFFIRGIGVVNVVSRSENIRIQSVFYTTDIDRNVLSFDQLITQGYTVRFMGEKCKIYPTFIIPVNNGRNGHSGMTREEEIGEVEKQNVMNKGHEHEKYKTEFLNKYFEKLNISSNKPDWNILILQAMKFNDFRDCKALLDMLEDVDYFLKYKYYLEITFDSMIEWFLKEKLKIHSRPLPAYASNNRQVKLLDLYMAVKREGGHRRITDNGMWGIIARDTGFEYEDGEYMRLIYAMYLDILVYYYKFKLTQERATEKEEEKIVDPRQSMSEGDNEVMTDAEQTVTAGCSSSTGAVEKEMKRYAFFAGNDWSGIGKLNVRSKFNFNRTKAAVDDANLSVLKNSRKPNYV